MKCERNCPGTIEDGYCDTCGMAPVAAPPLLPVPPLVAPLLPASGAIPQVSQ